MKKLTILLFTVFVTAVSAFVLFTQNQVSAESKNDFVTGEILVKFKDSAGPHEVSEAHKKLGGRVKEIILGINVQVVDVGGKSVGEAVSTYARNSWVEYVEPNYVASALVNDSELERQWGLNNTGQQTCNTAGDVCVEGTPDADVDAPEAWRIATGSPEVKIAILDSGIDLNHPDLMDKVVVDVKFTDSQSVDDLYGHGTHVAGIAAADTNNEIGVAGVGYESSLMNVKVLGDTGYGAYSWIAEGIIWAANNGADVINLSLGGPRKSITLESAINHAWDKGVVIVAAAGNSANPSKTYPGYYDKCIAVAATNNNDIKASFSSYGSWVDVAAPGENIYSTFPNHDFYLQRVYGRSNNYDFGNGTSMSTPYVAGIAALVWAENPGFSNQEVRNRIEQTADAVAGTGNYWTWGRVNACNAVGGNCSIEPSPTPSPTPEPDYSSCFKGVCDGRCHPAKDGASCPDCL